MANENRLILPEQDAIVMAEQELSTCRYIAECTRNPGMRAIHEKRCVWLSVLVGLAKKAATVDAVEVVHGRWKFGELDIMGQPVNCSVCGWGRDMVNKVMWLEYPAHKYCGNCGAKMDGGNEDG